MSTSMLFNFKASLLIIISFEIVQGTRPDPSSNSQGRLGVQLTHARLLLSWKVSRLLLTRLVLA